MITEAKHSQQSNVANTNPQNDQPLQGDDERDKKCPHCDEKFYFSSGVETHLTHAHGVPKWPPDITDNAVNDSNSVSNQPPLKLKPTTSGRNNDAKQGTDLQQYSSNVPENNVIGKNNANNQHMMGANINTTSPDRVQGINIPDTETVKGNNKQLGEALNDHPVMDAHASDLKPNLSTMSEQQSSMKMTATSQSTDKHKRRPKLRGKHKCPRIPSPLPTSDTDDRSISKQTSKLKFITVTHRLRKPKKTGYFKCNICSTVTDFQALVNKHYCKNHPPLKCPDCEQYFNNLCSLHRYKYSHLELKFPCRLCGCHFPFESDLVNHCIKHRRHPRHQCNHESEGKVCGKWFFAKSDLNKHTKIHSDKIHSCLECDYTTFDIRYLRAHRYTHSDREQYACAKCMKQFKHHTQLKCHLEKCS